MPSEAPATPDIASTRDKTLKVTEIFYSLQGESTHVGRPCVFIRLTACNLRCSWCDTTYSFTEGRPMRLKEILEQVESYPCRLVEVTGGEPLLQPEVYELLRALLDGKYQVLLETSGEQSISRVPQEVMKIVDVKCPSSGESGSFNFENLKHLSPHDELKFVIADEADYRFAREFIRTQPIPPKVAILFSPLIGPAARTDSSRGKNGDLMEDSWARARQVADWVLHDHLPVRLQTQLHKWLWGAETRGV